MTTNDDLVKAICNIRAVTGQGIYIPPGGGDTLAIAVLYAAPDPEDVLMLDTVHVQSGCADATPLEDKEANSAAAGRAGKRIRTADMLLGKQPPAAKTTHAQPQPNSAPVEPDDPSGADVGKNDASAA